MGRRSLIRHGLQTLKSTTDTCAARYGWTRAFASPATASEENADTAEKGDSSGATASDILLQDFANFKRKNKTTYRNVMQPSYLRTRTEEQKNMQSARPFPANPFFTSKPILSTSFRDEIYARVVEQGKSVRMVSSELGVTMERVAAVARMMVIQKRWESQGKKTYSFLDKAIHTMIPTTDLPSPQQPLLRPHESINDLPEHPSTANQMFVPTPEARQISRVEAGAAFGLPPADELIPHPQLVTLEKDALLGISKEDRLAKEQERDKQESMRRMAAARARALQESVGLETIERGRWRWRLRDGTVGQIGARYGVPHQDRKKGHVKIPTRIL